MEDNYFLHSTNLSLNDNVKKMIEKHGGEGYGILMALMEIFAKNDNILSLGIINDLICNIFTNLAWVQNKEMVKSIIYDFNIFEIENGYWFSCILLNDKLLEE